MRNLEQLIRKHIHEMVPYSSARSEYSGESGEIFLDANENPAGEFNRYPDPLQLTLKQSLAELWQVEKEQICLGNGSDEIVDLLVRASCEPGKDTILIFPPTYGMYKVVATLNGVTIVEAPLNSEFQIDLNSITTLDLSSTKLAFVCSPNNPTGNTTSPQLIEHFIKQFDGLVVVDEAYIDFNKKQSALSLLDRNENLVILRTLSKAWGLAGLRIGAAIAAPKVINYLNKIKPPYNISSPNQTLALKAILNSETLERSVEMIVSERERFIKQLKQIPCVRKIYPSEANFLLVRFNNARVILEKLRGEKIIVRDRSQELGCDNCLRITVGTPLENDNLITALGEMDG